MQYARITRYFTENKKKKNRRLRNRSMRDIYIGCSSDAKLDRYHRYFSAVSKVSVLNPSIKEKILTKCPKNRKIDNLNRKKIRNLCTNELFLNHSKLHKSQFYKKLILSLVFS